MTIKRVPFKYSSADQLLPEASFSASALAPEDVIFLVTENVRAMGGQITDRGTTSYIHVQAPDADACWHANRHIEDEEFAAYAANDHLKFVHIDRVSPFKSVGVEPGCPFVNVVATDKADKWFLEAHLNRRASTAMIPITSVVQNFNTFHGTVTPPNRPLAGGYNVTGQSSGLSVATTATSVQMEFESVYRLWVRSDGHGDSVLQANALPMTGRVISSMTSSVPYAWWPQIDGRVEADLVRDMFFRLQEEERFIRQSSAKQSSTSND